MGNINDLTNESILSKNISEDSSESIETIPRSSTSVQAPSEKTCDQEVFITPKSEEISLKVSLLKSTCSKNAF